MPYTKEPELCIVLKTFWNKLLFNFYILFTIFYIFFTKSARDFPAPTWPSECEIEVHVAASQKISPHPNPLPASGAREILEAGDTAWAPRCSVGRTAGFRDFDGETPSCTGLCGGRTRHLIE